MVGEKRRSIV